MRTEVIALVFVLLVVEFVAYVFCPHVLARLAYLPLPHLHVQATLPESVRSVAADGTYRQAARRSVRVDELSLPKRLVADQVVGEWMGASGWLRTTVRLVGFNNSLALARITATIDGARISFGARLLPIPVSILPFPLLFPFLVPDDAIVVGWLVSVGFIVVLVCVQTFVAWCRIREPLQHVLAQLAEAASQ